MLLGLLRQNEMHGYELHGFIENAMYVCVDLKKATAYFLLDKMATAGWIRVSEQREGNRPLRKVYQLTPAGEAKFQELLRDNLSQFSEIKSAGDVGLAFLDTLPPDDAKHHLLNRRIALQAQIDLIRQAPPHAGTMQLVLEHRQHTLDSELVWLDSVIAKLGKQTKSKRARK